MTATRDATRKHSRAKAGRRDARIVMQDMMNTYAFATDPVFRESVEKGMERVLAVYRDAMEKDGCASVWVDGSHNAKTGASGIGIVIGTGSGSDYGLSAFGKSVKAKSSVDAEVYALAIGISYLLDTYPGIKNVRLRYDCLNATVCAANIDAYVPCGAPYTNFRSAMKRARKAGVAISFEHVKAHNKSRNNETADLIARYYAKARLGKCQMDAIRKYVKINDKSR